MKRIFFLEKKFKGWQTSLLLMSIGLLIVGFYLLFTQENSKWGSICLLFMHLINVFNYSRPFFYKNYVDYNKSQMSIKLNNSGLELVTFDFVSTVKYELENNILKIIDNKGLEKTFNTKDILKSDVDRLVIAGITEL